MKKIIVIPISIIYSCSFAQHIQYRDKGNNKPLPPQTVTTLQPAKVESKPVVEKKNITPPKPDTVVTAVKTKSAKFKSEPIQVRKKMEEFITGCKLSADPDKVAQLPLVINDVPLAMVAKLKERYKNRIYSITGLNMIDIRLKLKLKICDKDGGKFRIEYLDKDGNIVNDPSLDYYEF